MNKKISVGVTLALMLLVAALTFTVTTVVSLNLFNQRVYNISERETMYAKLSEIDGIVRQNYAGTIDETHLGDMIAVGYLSGLDDRFAAYIPAENYADAMTQMGGNMVGIGIQMTRDTSGYILVTNVYSTGPAYAAGLKVGDLIVKIGDTDVAAVGYSSATELLAGSEGTTVKLTYRRDSADKELEIVRKRFEIESVTGEMIGENGYIRIQSFNGTTYSQFNKVVNSLIDQGAKGLIFDLRDNGGGTLDATGQMLDKLLPEGVLMTATTADGTTEPLFTSGPSCVELPMVCLVNSGTASASEIFAASLRDFGVCKLVGTKTYGKGVMQHTYTLNDGSAIEFTVAKLNPPKSDNYDGVGLKPDFEVKADSDTAFYLLDKEDDLQLQKAIEVVNSMKKTVL